MSDCNSWFLLAPQILSPNLQWTNILYMKNVLRLHWVFISQSKIKQF